MSDTLSGTPPSSSPTPSSIPERQLRAHYTDAFVRVYQAYGDAIADSAVAHRTFVSPPFSMTRMTWVKPSFLWMMYRSGWAAKDDGQRRILAVDLAHDGFRWLVANGSASHFDPARHASKEDWEASVRASDVVIQWDPERDIHLNKLAHRTIQIGLRNDAVRRYVNEWIVGITDITPTVHRIHALLTSGATDDARALLPIETVYPAP